jgi:dsDNA-specific endonuclease/ATPase MutS2
VVREARNGGRFLVELKGRSVVVAAADMAPASSAGAGPKAPRRTAQVEGDGPEAPSPPFHDARARSLDLHGLTSAEAIEALDMFLNDALLAGAGEARIIHGRSGGKLKAAVHARLRELPSIRGFRLDPANPGVTIVRM